MVEDGKTLPSRIMVQTECSDLNYVTSLSSSDVPARIEEDSSSGRRLSGDRSPVSDGKVRSKDVGLEGSLGDSTTILSRSVIGESGSVDRSDFGVWYIME